MGEKPSKKQRELLDYIGAFNDENGFSPSYREIMAARNYKSVSTVAVHINNLVARGLLRKIDNHARTLEVVSESAREALETEKVGHLDWLRQEIAKRESNLELAADVKILKSALALLDQTDET